MEYETKLGKCEMFVTPIGSDNFVSVGTVSDATIVTKRETVNLLYNYLKTDPVMTDVELDIVDWEWHAKSFVKVFGGSVTEEEIGLDGSLAVMAYQVRLFPVDHKIIVDFYRCKIIGSLEFQFNPTEFNKFCCKFKAFMGKDGQFYTASRL